MTGRKIAAIVLGAISVPLMVLGLVDPLEGGISLVAAIVLIVVARLLAATAAPRLLWIPSVVAVALGAAALAVALFSPPRVGADGTVTRSGDLAVTMLVWGYRLAVLVVVAGAVLYVARLVRATRVPR